MRKMMIILMILIGLLMISSGCYSPSWYKTNTTYSDLHQDSNICKEQLILGDTREEKILSYERCMVERRYILTDKADRNIGESNRNIERTVFIYSRDGVFHKESCPTHHEYLRAYNKVQIPRNKAIGAGLRPCHICRP